MADQIQTPRTGITAEFLGVGPSGLSRYNFLNVDSGKQQEVTLAYGPDQLTPLFGSDLNTAQGMELAKTLSPTFSALSSRDESGRFNRLVKPILRSIPAYIAGAVPDIQGLLSYVPDPGQLVSMGYEALTGDDLLGMNEQRKSANIQKRQFAADYGSAAQQKRFSQYLRAADSWAKDNWGFAPFEDSVGTDMTPEARGFWEKVLKVGLETAVSGPPMVLGVTAPAKMLQGVQRFLLSRFAKESVRELGEDALDPKNVQTLVDKAYAAYNPLTKGGRRNLSQEATFGSAAGASTVGGLEILDNVDPDAAGWIKASVALGSGLIAPIAARGVFTGLLQGPVIGTVTKLVVDPLFRPSRSATSFAQKQLGSGSQDRAAVLSVATLLRAAIADGRHVDEASGLVFTTPELARTEANILRSEVQIKRERLSQETDEKVRERLEKEIETDEINVGNLNRTSNFYEAVLESAAKDKTPGVASRFFQAETKRLVERRDQFFNYIEGQFKRSVDELDFNGKPGGTPDEHRVDLEKALQGNSAPEFEVNRRKLVMEGDPRGVESSELLWLEPQTASRVDAIRVDLSAKMDEVLANAQEAAQRRVEFWQQDVELYARNRGLKTAADLPEAERKLVGDLIRSTYDDAAREFRAFESAAYSRINGLDSKVTENIVFPKGSRDPSDGADISGMTVEEWASSRFDNLSPTEAFNPKEVPQQLAQLAGSRTILAQMNRRQMRDAETGGPSGSDEKILVLERRRNDAVAQRDELDAEMTAQVSADRVASEAQSKALTSYVQMAHRDSSMVPRNGPDFDPLFEMDKFVNNPDIIWKTLSPAEARAYAPPGAKKMGNAFAEIARQKKIIAGLGDGTVSSTAVRAIDKRMSAFADTARKAQRDIEDITQKILGVGDDVQVPESGRLTARDGNGNLVRSGTSAEDVREVVSDLSEAARVEKDLNGISPKYRKIQQIRETVEQLLDSRTFPELDAGQLNFAREASRVKNSVTDSQGPVLEKRRNSEVKVEVENVPEKVLPNAAGASELRLLQQSTAEVPDFVTITRGDDGVTVATIDEKALDGSASLFERPDSPFEMVSVGQAGTPFEIRLKQNAPVSDRSLKLAESIILERLALDFPDGVDSNRLQSFRKNNKVAIKFLEDNGFNSVPDLLNNADGLALQLDVLANLRRDKTKRQLTELVESGSLDLEGLKIDDYLDYIGQRRKRISEKNAFSEVLNSDPGRAVGSLFDRVLGSGNSRPKQDMQEFMSIVRGNKQAEKGFQASVLGQLFERSLSRSDLLIKETGDSSFQAFDPVKFRELIGDPRVRTILLEAFPDNGDLLGNLDNMAKVAFETSNFTQGGKLAGGVNPAEAVNLSGWGFLGRVAALGAADSTRTVNALWAGAAGSKVGQTLGLRVTGSKIKDILIDAALNPDKGAALVLRASDQRSGLANALRRAAIDVVDVSGRPASRLAITKRAEEELDDDPPPVQRRLAPVNTQAPPFIVPGSVLNQVNPTGGAPVQQAALAAQGPGSPQVAERGQSIFGMNDPVFAASGGHITGIMAVKPKPRQMVG